ncbi:MAG TPA: hypothetical protein PLS00_00520 [Niabella sp.]|nr:hypothetical protein [Niabella sp.]
MNIYLTFADQPSGVYRSQVENVIKYLNQKENLEIRLLAFISIREYCKNRKKIKENIKYAIVVPMLPRLKNWQYNRFLLYIIFFLLKPKTVIARGVLAGWLAIKCRDKKFAKVVVYDGRGAISAEWNEYQVVNNGWLRSNIFYWEKEVVLSSDKQIAVSNKLIEFWEEKFEYSGLNSVVIPCTLSNDYETLTLNNDELPSLRKKLGLPQDDIILVYSGSVAGWQSSELLSEFLTTQFNLQKNLSVLFLSKETNEIIRLMNRFPDRVFCTFLSPSKVPEYLMACDYGLLIRESSITNKVASPVKFAEYLACGLKVIISPQIGDYSEMAVKNEVGILINQYQSILKPIDRNEKKRFRYFALKHFSKSFYRGLYTSIINNY